MKQRRLLLGAHLSIAHGLNGTIKESISLKCTTFQIFTKSNRQWYAKELSDQVRDSFFNEKKTTNINPVIAHASYLLNIGSSNKTLRDMSIQSLVSELERCSILSIPYLIIHPGSHSNTDEQSCLEMIISSLNVVIELYRGPTMILLETMAGQGSSICYTLEQLRWILHYVTEKKRVGICVDTCHVFAAGYDIKTPTGYSLFWQQYEEVLGLHSLKVIHLNDSKKACGSRIDRHEHIGQGLLGIEPFRCIMNDPRFFDIPKILETPIDENGNHETNITLLKSLITRETKEMLYVE